MTGFTYDRKIVMFSVKGLFVVFDDVGVHVYRFNTQWLTLYIFLICGFVCIYIRSTGGWPLPAYARACACIIAHHHATPSFARKYETSIIGHHLTP